MKSVAGLPFSAALALLLAACGGQPPRPAEPPGTPAVEAPPPVSRPAVKKPPAVVLKKGGGFYKDDGPGDDIPDNLDDIPDAEPRWEPLHKPATRPYVVLGRDYVPNTSIKPYKARGIASWYGKKFHGQKTSTGEIYDMFGMSAAHTTLALPSYVRVSNPRNGRAVVVRVNDRGPFHVDRIIDLSYTAAYKLGLINNGSGEVEIEAIIPAGSPDSMAALAPPRPERPADLDALLRRLESAESAATPVVAAKGVYLQLGAFANADNAENLKNRLGSELDWLAEPLRVYPANGIHRLQAGPYPNREAAERVAERIRQALGTRPAFVTR